MIYTHLQMVLPSAPTQSSDRTLGTGYTTDEIDDLVESVAAVTNDMSRALNR